jgi:putative effector of murein hydrolase
VAYGTAGHVVGTSKAMERSALAGAASSLSLVVAGLLTAVVLPLVASYL